jgi:hypothetical protein
MLALDLFIPFLILDLYSVDTGANSRIIVDELLPFILLVVSVGFQEVAGKSCYI